MGQLQDVTWQHVNDILKRLNYDTSSLTITSDTGITGVKVNIGQEEMYLVCNNTGVQIDNGKAVYASGVDVPTNCVEIDLADSASFQSSAQVLGLATHDIPDGTLGLVTERGVVRSVDTSLLSSGLLWLGSLGNLTNVQPLFPLQRVAMGTLIKSGVADGEVLVTINRITRNDISKSYPFSSTGVGSGTFWIAGFYDFATTSVSLSQASTTQTYGTVGIAKAAHAGIVASGAGVVDTGQVGLRIINSVQDFEDGSTQLASQSAVITEDITTLSANEYIETPEKWSGQITYELYVVSGTPVNYSLTFNYGFSKYDDIQDRDYTIKGFETKWQGNASSTLDIALMKHTTTGWTYAPTGFVAGNGDICRKSVDQAIAGDVANNEDGAWKRVNLNTYIAGESGIEGHIIQIVTGANGTVQILSCHADVVSEELDF